MEVCGGQTHSIVKFGVDALLPPEITLVHGPGCPVCVTPIEQIDKAISIASRPEVIFCSFGDMMRVPGTRSDLLRVKADGGDVRMVYSPVDAVEIAVEEAAGAIEEVDAEQCSDAPGWEQRQGERGMEARGHFRSVRQRPAAQDRRT